MTTKKFLCLEGDYVEHIKPRSFDVVIKTNKKIQISCKLIIAADGRNSNIREISKIKKIKYDYNQKALVFNIKHEYNHDSKSYEIYKSEGPCTLVPLKTKQFNGYFSSVVLMIDDKNNDNDRFVIFFNSTIKPFLIPNPLISIINNSFTIFLVSLYYIGSILNILNVDVACHRTLARFYDFFFRFSPII